MIKHIIFDCFGTLIDTEKNSQKATERILKNIGADLNAEKFYADWKRIKRKMMESTDFENEKTLFTLSLSDVFEKYGIEKDASLEVVPMIEALFSERHVFPEVKDALIGLSEKGCDFAIGSTTDTDSLMYCLEFNDLHFDNIYTSENMRVYKPDRKFYKTILERSGWKAEDCLFVGDNYIDDVLGPKSIGIKAALLDRKGVYTAVDMDPKPDFIINTVSELIGIVER